MVLRGMSLCLSISLFVICLFLCQYFHFRMITRVNVNGVHISGFSPNLLCALILCRSGLGLLIGKIHSFLTELSTCHTSILLFLDNKLSKY